MFEPSFDGPTIGFLALFSFVALFVAGSTGQRTTLVWFYRATP